LVSRWLHDEVKVGDEIEIEAPNGTFFFTGEEAESVVLIGGGVGITPMMSAARYLTDTNWSGKIYLILSFQAPRDFIFREELAELQARNADGAGGIAPATTITTAAMRPATTTGCSAIILLHILGLPPGTTCSPWPTSMLQTDRHCWTLRRG
jgi:NAD(P)H-flavin reductase